MRFQEFSFSISINRVIELWKLNLCPGSQKNNVCLDDLIFKSSSESSSWSFPWRRLFDLTSNSRHCFDLSSFISWNLQLWVEHVLDEGSVLVNLKWRSNQLDFLWNHKVMVSFNNHTIGSNSEIRSSIIKIFNPNEYSSHRVNWSIAQRITVPKFGCVLYHPFTVSLIFCNEDRYCLESPPTHWEYDRVFALEYMRIPSMLFEFDSHVAKLSLLSF